jgi:hypothetical protein
MNLAELIQALQQALALVPADSEVVTSFEQATLEEGFSWEHTEGISDVRICNDWPLPGDSMLVAEHEKPFKVIIFYDIHSHLNP